MEGEVDHHLSTQSNRPSLKDQERNRRNGKSTKTIQSSSGIFELVTPMERDGSFDPQIVRKRQTHIHPERENKVSSLFTAGVSYADISAHIEDFL